MAPEVALNQPYNEKVDMYSYAIILYEIITGHPPFDGYNKTKMYREAVHKGARPSLEYDEYGRKITIRPLVRGVIEQCWDPIAANRMSAEQVYHIVREEEEAAAVAVPTRRESFVHSIFGRPKDLI